MWVGCSGAPSDHCSNNQGGPNSTIDESPVVVEKPYIIFENGRYYLMRPRAEFNKRNNTAGWENADMIDFEKVYVVKSTDTASIINTKLEEGLHLVFQPWIYKLEESIKVKNNGTVVLGLGLATLQPVNGTPAFEITG